MDNENKKYFKELIQDGKKEKQELIDKLIDNSKEYRRLLSLDETIGHYEEDILDDEYTKIYGTILDISNELDELKEFLIYGQSKDILATSKKIESMFISINKKLVKIINKH